MIITKQGRTEGVVIDELIGTCKGLEGLVNTGKN
jgi:hypothetical protein